MAVRLWGLLAALEQRCFVSSSSSRLAASTSTAGVAGFSSTHCTARRSYSTSAGGRVAEADDDVAAEEAEDLATRNKLEQALRELRIYSAAPDWLPLFPGGSYWIHPEQIGPVGGKAEKASGPMMDPANEREVLAMVSPMGWPVESAASDAMKPEPDFRK